MQSDSRDAVVLNHFVDGVQRYRWMGSPLYSAFCRRIVDDADLLALAGEARPGQPFTYPLLSAAHMLVLGGADTPLADYYASVTPTPKQDVDGAFQAFRTFCLDRRSDLLPIMKERVVQLTFVGRAAFVLPALAYVARLAGEPLSFIDVGCSAGLLTMFTHYFYDYGLGRRIGGTADLALAPFRFESPTPGFLTGIPKLGPVVGIDLNPVSAVDPIERRWIEALYAPDMIEDRRRLRAALDLRARTPLTVLKGDASILLPDLLATMPDPICVLAAHCLYQWPAEARDALDRTFRQASIGRRLYLVTIDHPTGLDPSLARRSDGGPATEMPLGHEAVLTVYDNEASDQTRLGRYDGYGRRGEWLAKS
jgi:hypothetical protein